MINITLIYATQTGFTYKLVQHAISHFKSQQLSLLVDEASHYDITNLPNQEYVLFIIPTISYGQFPFSFQSTWKFLTRKSLSSCLQNLHFAIFGIGDSSYQLYNYASRKLHSRLKELGGKELISLTLGDQSSQEGCYDTFDLWLNQTQNALKLTKGEAKITQQIYFKEDTIFDGVITKIERQMENIYYVEIETEKTIQLWSDIGVFPFHPYKVKCCDYFSSPSKQLLQYLYQVTSSSQLCHLLENKKAFHHYTHYLKKSLIEIMDEFNVKDSWPEHVVSLLPKIYPRYYSVIKTKGHSITVCVKSYFHKVSPTRLIKGFCSNFLTNDANVKIPFKVIERPSNRVSITSALIVAIGVSICSVIQLIANKTTDHKWNIYYGCPSKEQDLFTHIIKKEGVDLLKKHIDCQIAYSKEDNKHVNDCIKADQSTLQQIMEDTGLTIIICGKSKDYPFAIDQVLANISKNYSALKAKGSVYFEVW